MLVVRLAAVKLKQANERPTQLHVLVVAGGRVSYTTRRSSIVGK